MNPTPLVMCLTNAVAANFTANCLLAVGAKPAMVEDAEEAAALVARADALLVNVGTLHSRQREVMRRAVKAAVERRLPWVLDPVAVQYLPARLEFVRELLAFSPAVIRGNRAETACLGQARAVMLATGEVDRLYSAEGELVEEIAGGTPLLEAVTATGCAQGALVAAALARALPPLRAAQWAARLMKRAGEGASARTAAPGSFQVALLDELWRLSHA